jgi:ADP-heptose:LPS heptosyltransferase
LNRILVVRVGALGDTLMVTPALRALRRDYPEAEIDFLCSETAAALLEANPHIARVFRLRRRNLPYRISPEKWRLVEELRSRNYDLAILLESAPRYRELLRLAGIHGIQGFAEVPFDPGQHCIVNYLNVTGAVYSRTSDLDMELRIAAAEEDAARQALKDLPTPLIGVQTGYGPRKGKKNQSQRLRGWSQESFIQLIRGISARPGTVLLTGSEEDRPDAVRIAQRLPQDCVRVLAGRTTIGELAAIIGNLDLFISVDTGPAHIAAALGTPLVVLWGPGIYEQTRPLSSASPIKIVRFSVPCAPCYGTPLMKSCKRNICMERISPAAVLEAAESMLIRNTC